MEHDRNITANQINLLPGYNTWTKVTSSATKLMLYNGAMFIWFTIIRFHCLLICFLICSYNEFPWLQTSREFR